jgi:SAM-dependent methyltransferase
MMSTGAMQAEASEFDAVADHYEVALQQGLRISGESSAYFAAHRVEWLQRRLVELGAPMAGKHGIDFGCGTGNSLPYLRRILGLASVTGLDPSLQSLRVAKRLHPDPSFHFHTPDAYAVHAGGDLVFCNGVFHHIPPGERPRCVARIREFLGDQGIFAFWENNPWNPGTRYVMKRIPFDRDAIPLSIPESRRMLEEAGFGILCVDTCFYFPRLLGFLRRFEPCLCKVPLGAQYLILAKKLP